MTRTEQTQDTKTATDPSEALAQLRERLDDAVDRLVQGKSGRAGW